MSPIWVVPVLVVVLGGLVVAALVRQAASAAGELAAEISRLGDVANALGAVGEAARRRGAAVGAPSHR